MLLEGGVHMKKIMSIISNILSVIFVCPFSLYFSTAGLIVLSITDFNTTFIDILNTIAGISWICTLPVCILGIVLSCIFRGKEKYKESYLVQLLPFVFVIIGVFAFVVSIIWGNP